MTVANTNTDYVKYKHIQYVENQNTNDGKSNTVGGKCKYMYWKMKIQMTANQKQMMVNTNTDNGKYKYR